MAQIVLKDGKVWVGDVGTASPLTAAVANEVEVSGVAALTLEDSVETPETTTFGNDSRRHIPGLKDASGSIEVVVDFGAGENGPTLEAVYGERRQWVFSPYGKGGTGDAFTATEPGYTCNATLTTRPIASGSVGDVARQTLNIKVDGDLVRVTAGTV